MNKLKFYAIVLVIVFSVNSCHQAGETDSYDDKVASTETFSSNNEVNPTSVETEAPLSSTAATHQDAEKEFIRKADLSMEVENVYKSTTKIESKISELGGFVANSSLNSRVFSTETFPISSDSALEIRKYTVNNEMTIRIPQKELGNFLSSLGEEMKFLYFRNISAQDVSLNFIAAELEKERLNSTRDQLGELNHQKGKITDKQGIANNMDHKKSEANRQEISILKMKDDVVYSTVSLLIQEKEKVAQTMVINPNNYDDKYRPDFLYRAKVSVTEGFHFFQTICIGLLYIWPVWLLAILIYFFVKHQLKKTKTT